MKIIKLENLDSEHRKVRKILAEGGVIAYPTDTIYGFHCLASRPDSVGGILALKGKEKTGLIALVSDLEMADRLVREWPGAPVCQ